VEYKRPGHPPAIAARNGEDVSTVLNNLSAVKTVGGNTDFKRGDIDLSFLNSKQQMRAGQIHQHSDGLVHLDNYNPFSSFPLGAIGHLFVDVILGSINSSVPMVGQ
jgi:hypothetical protein